jgi:serine/threonine-protein kinase
MGVLYRAHDAALERDVALKMMHLDFTADSHARERFQREARAVARLQHPNIVTIHELGEYDDTPFIVMEFLAGRDLEALLKDGTELTLGRKLDIAAQLCEGLAYAHDLGIVHRDIKPGNVRVLDDGKVKILDFGIARFAASSLTQSGTVMGTPSYMAPEQIMGQPVDGRADLFSAGVLFYELLSGQKPFVGDSATAVAYNIMNSEMPSLRESIPDLPDAVNEIVSRALKKNPNERYSHAREMASDLQTVRMMLDLPLTPTVGGMSASAATTTISASELFASGVRSKAGAAAPRTPTGSGLGNLPIRPNAEAALADAAPRAAAVERKRSALMVPGLAIGGTVLVVGWLLMTFMNAPAEPTTSEVDAAAAAAAATAAAAAAAAPAVPATFRVTSTPAGAGIALDGTDTGMVTPADVPLSGRAPQKLQLTLAGHEALTADITAADLEAGTKAYTLEVEPMAVRLTISAPFPFELVRGSTVVSQAATSHQVTVEPGTTINARNSAVLLNQRVSLNFRRRAQSVSLAALGTLRVFASGSNNLCSVVADGRDIGFPPIPNMPVAEGNHTIVLKCPDGTEKKDTARVSSGGQATVTFPGEEGKD